MSERAAGTPGPRSERPCPPLADYWGWPLFGYPPCHLYGDRRFGVVGRAHAMDAHTVGASADEQQVPTTSAPARRAEALIE